MASATVGVCVEEALDDGVVVSGLQVIEAGFRIVVVAVGAKMGSIGLFKSSIKKAEKWQKTGSSPGRAEALPGHEFSRSRRRGSK